MKFTDSVFSPDEEYLAGYSDVYKAFLQSEERATKDKGVQDVVRQINKRTKFLPGTVPSIKILIIEVIKGEQVKGYNGLGKLDNALRYNWWYNTHLCVKHLHPAKKATLPPPR